MTTGQHCNKKPGNQKDRKRYCRATKKARKHHCRVKLPGNIKGRQPKRQETLMPANKKNKRTVSIPHLLHNRILTCGNFTLKTA